MSELSSFLQLILPCGSTHPNINTFRPLTCSQLPLPKSSFSLPDDSLVQVQYILQLTHQELFEETLGEAWGRWNLSLFFVSVQPSLPATIGSANPLLPNRCGRRMFIRNNSIGKGVFSFFGQAQP
jgi:hypothetical protein